MQLRKWYRLGIQNRMGAFSPLTVHWHHHKMNTSEPHKAACSVTGGQTENEEPDLKA